MRVAIIHDYLKEFGGAERVLEALCEIYPDAPIYTAFYKEGSVAYERFKDRKIISSWVQNIPFFVDKLHSPLRFLAPLIWGSFKEELQEYDVVISSASWYVTKGFGQRQEARDKRQGKPVEICYCHTPPRWLYGYTTSVNFQKYPLVKAYAAIVGHFMRLFDFKQAQKVDYFIANSEEVAGRIKKFYRRDSTVIYPPVGFSGSTHPLNDSLGPSGNTRLAREDESSSPANNFYKNSSGEKVKRSFHGESRPYYFIVSRLVGGKGLEIAVEAALKMGFKLKIAGSISGYYFEYNNLTKKLKRNIEFLGQVTDEELVKLYKGAKAFLALSRDEDFGITPVEAMSVGTPVIAFNGGGYKETVVSGKTGLLFDDLSVDGLTRAIKEFESLKLDPKDSINQAAKFSKERFKKKIKNAITEALRSSQKTQK